MSRGLGRVQRDLLEQLRARNHGAGILPGENGGNTRRAARGLERRGLVKLEKMLIWGRWRLVARLGKSRCV